MSGKYIIYNNDIECVRNSYKEALEKAKELNKTNNQSYYVLKLMAEIRTKSAQVIEEFECD